MAVTLFFYGSHNNSTPKESRSAAKTVAAPEKVKLENADGHIIPDPVKGVQRVVAGKLGKTTLATTSEKAKVENAAERDIVHDPVAGVHRAAAGKLGPSQKASAAKENDPVELWKAVKRGSVNAEVALANLYLEGREVPRNCEQAHMLLSAAAIKGSKAADDYLKGSYAERCE
jgi:TPR repeat protein